MRNIWLVAKREMLVRMRSKAYIIGTIAIILGVVGLSFLASRGSGSEEMLIPEYARQQIAAQTEAREYVYAEYGLDVAEIDAKIAAKFEEIMAAYEAENPSGLNDSKYWVGYIVGILLFVAIVMTGTMIAQGVAEEKSSRIVEILLGSMSSFQLMAGKIVGIGIVGLVQIGVILGAGYVSAAAFGLIGDVFVGVDFGSAIIIALAFFIVGYFSYAALYAAFASMVSRAEEVNVAIQPVMYILLVPYMATVIPTLAEIGPIQHLLNYLPLWSPIGAVVHYFQGSLTTAQALLSLSISAVALPLIMYMAATIYRRSVLATGARLRIKDVLNKS